MKRKHVSFFVDSGPVVPDRQILEAKELLRPDEVSDILRVSRRTVYLLIEDGKLQGLRVRGALRVKTESLRRFLGLIK